MPPEKEHVLKSVTRHMLLRNAIPCAMLDRNTRLCAYGLESHFNFGVQALRKRCLPPTKDEAAPRLPSPDTSNLEDFSIRQFLNEASSLASFEPHDPRTARSKLEQCVWLPPGGDLLREDIERARRARGHTHRNKDARSCHFRRRGFSMCALNESS